MNRTMEKMLSDFQDLAKKDHTASAGFSWDTHSWETFITMKEVQLHYATVSKDHVEISVRRVTEGS